MSAKSESVKSLRAMRELSRLESAVLLCLAYREKERRWRERWEKELLREPLRLERWHD